MKKLLVILFFLAFAAWQVLGTSLGLTVRPQYRA